MIKILSNQMSKVTPFILVMVIVLFFASIVHSGAQTKQKISSDTKSELLSTLTNEEELAVSLAAGKILSHAESARLSLLKKKNDDAVRHIDQGLKLVYIIENVVPKRKVTTDIKSGDLAYHNEEEVVQRYITIYDESYVEDIVTPVLQSKKSKLSLKPTNKVEKSKDEPVTVTPTEEFSMWNHTSMKLDVILAKRMLEEAENALKNSKSDDAITDLETIQTQGVTFRFETAELPLVEGANNLKIAQLEVQEGKYPEALSTLKLASDDLKKYEQLAGESRGKEVHGLHQEIDKLTNSLDDEKDLKKAMKDIEKSISSWWGRATNWFKK
ncbi:MAG: hypothetical protein MRK02_15080 [Candidatus Scalindua sp.]|nr:hypothetical protein [Candidatus Scalindua sp.]